MKLGKKFKIPWLVYKHPSTLLSFFLWTNIRQFFFCRNFFLIFFYEKMSRRSAKTSTKRPVEKESEGSGFDLNKKQRKVYKDATEAIESAYIFLFLLKKKINIIPAKFYLIIC